jgi:hypothetical protein
MRSGRIRDDDDDDYDNNIIYVCDKLFLDIVDILNYFSTLYMTASNILFGPSYCNVRFSVVSFRY